MKTTRWEQISQLYHAALSREGDCAAFLKHACADDEELRLIVDSLLAQPASEETFLTQLPWLRAADVVTGRTSMRRSHPTGVDQVQLDRLREGLADRYRIVGELGRGGMATVYLADDLKHGRKVAIKTLYAEMAATIGHKRFLREIQIAARLTHPHILPLHDSGEANGQLYYVMPYIEGESLRVHLDREKSLSIDAAVRLTREIASALEYAHQHGVIHRDIKPGNVLLAEGIALVADFGIARAVSASVDQHTGTGIIVGTPLYMSPEQATGGEVDGRSDLYSLGCVLYEMLAGEPPFTGSSAMVVLAQHALEEMPPLKSRRPGVPEALESVLRKSLAKSPADRHPTAVRFVEALSAAVAGWTISSHRRESAFVPNNLPKERTRFIGRETELAECARLLGEARLLTVTGIGGSGKTRLAVRLAESLLQSHPDGVWFVDFSPLREASRVVDTIALTLAIGEDPGKGLLETVVHHLRGKRLLLVLDNCEHLLDACAAFVDTLLRNDDEVRVLLTSREILRLDGERVISLRSLAVPSKAGVDAMKSSEAMQLFVDRAQIVDREFVLDAHCVRSVAEICRRLDGIPLAIELAAARIQMLSVDEIRSKLDDRFRLLTSGTTVLPRHRTLQAAFQWSYDLLSADEQHLFRLLAVFAGGWTLEAATAVRSDAGDEFEVLELMTHLADKSLVIIERLASGTSRYRMLEIVRQFAQEKLNEQGEEYAARARHLNYFAAWSERRVGMADGARQGEWLTQVEHEHENLLLALEFCPRAESGANMALDLACDLYEYWNFRGLYGVGRERLSAALRLPEGDSLARAWALSGMGYFALKQRALTEAQKCFEASLMLSRNSSDARGRRYPGPAENCIIVALYGLGWVSSENDPGAAQAYFEEALHLAREFGQDGPIGLGLSNLGLLAFQQDDLPRARVLFEETLALTRPMKDPWNVALGLIHLTEVALRSGAREEARRNLTEGLRIVREQGLRALALPALRRSSELAVAAGDAARGARWFAAAATLAHAMGSKGKPEGERTYAAAMARGREILGAQEFARVTAEGTALDYEEALAEAQIWLQDSESEAASPRDSN
jgi:non-specific serine/threonine protein kinase